MFKNTVLVMALVMVTANAFAAVEAKNDARDKERIEDASRAEGIDAAKQAGITDARDQDVVSRIVEDTAKRDKGAAANLAKAIIKAKGNRVSGKTVGEIEAGIANEIRKQNIKPGTTDAQDATVLAEFVVIDSQSVSGNLQDASQQAADREAELAPKILSWKGTARTSHMTLIKEVLKKMKTKVASSAKAATDLVFKERFGAKSEEKKQEVAHCEE